MPYLPAIRNHRWTLCAGVTLQKGRFAALLIQVTISGPSHPVALTPIGDTKHQ